jgi:hypothetical protein
MQDIYITECLEEEDKIAGINLLSKAFSGATNQETLAWHESALKYKKHTPLMVCAKDGEKVVSVNNWLPWEFVYEGKKYLAYHSCEGATDNGYRGKGLWRKLIKYGNDLLAGRDIDFLFCFLPPLSYYPLCRAGYHPMGAFRYRARVINPFKKPDKEKADKELTKWSWNGLVEKNKITPQVDQDYYEWRYQANPKHYDMVRYDEDNNQALFIVRRTKYYNSRYHIRLNELLLLDCQFTSYYEPFIRSAIKYLESKFSRSVFYIRTFFNENTDRGKAIAPYFPIYFGSSHETLAVIPIKGKIDQQVLLNLNHWDVMPHYRDNL